MGSVAEIGRVDHAVVFYDHDAELLGALAEFVAAGLAAGDVCVVVVTPAHRDGLQRALAGAGWDVAAARADGHLVVFDAGRTLATLMVDGAVDLDAFRAVAWPLVATPTPGGGGVRIYGEIVALLWAAGDVVGALALEQWWHELGASQPFALLCGYPSDAFAGQGGAEQLQQVCATHETVIGDLPATPPPVATLAVLVVDAHALVRAGLAALIAQEPDLAVAATVATVEAAVAAAGDHPPDVVVFDPDSDGVGLIVALQAGGHDPPTLALSATAELGAVHYALAGGATSYVLKQASAAAVLAAIRQTAAGETVLSPELALPLAAGSWTDADDRAHQPTAQERRILCYLSEGLTNAQIAHRPDMPSVRTVQKHMENVSHKLGAHNRVELIATAYRRGLFT